MTRLVTTLVIWVVQYLPIYRDFVKAIQSHGKRWSNLYSNEGQRTQLSLGDSPGTTGDDGPVKPDTRNSVHTVPDHVTDRVPDHVTDRKRKYSF